VRKRRPEMAKSFGKIDKCAMDIISGSMYSLNFLRNISVAIFDQTIGDMTVREFHTAWLKKAKYTGHSHPYCLGSILGYLYCGILLSKERWYDLLPEDPVKDAPSEWGLAGVKYNSPKTPDPSIKYAIRRMRNALGHGNISIDVPHDLDYRKDAFDFEKRSFIRFYDEDPRDKSDVFEIEISIYGLSALVKKFQGLVYPKIIKDLGQA
jgi:hypothetical protein